MKQRCKWENNAQQQHKSNFSYMELYNISNKKASIKYIIHKIISIALTYLLEGHPDYMSG